jgi:hypothetical protein
VFVVVFVVVCELVEFVLMLMFILMLMWLGWWVGGCCHAVTDYLLLLVCSSVRVFCPGTNGFESRIKKTHKQTKLKISAKKFSSQKSCEADQQQ